MHGQLIQQSMYRIDRVCVPILIVVSWTGKVIFRCPRSRLKSWSRETGSAVPSRVGLLISVLGLNLALTYEISPGFHGGVHLFILNRHTPSGQSRLYWVTQMRTDGVHCRESAGTGPVNLKAVPNECCLGRSPWTNWYPPLFPTPTIGMKLACWMYRQCSNVIMSSVFSSSLQLHMKGSLISNGMIPNTLRQGRYQTSSLAYYTHPFMTKLQSLLSCCIESVGNRLIIIICCFSQATCTVHRCTHTSSFCDNTVEFRGLARSSRVSLNAGVNAGLARRWWDTYLVACTLDLGLRENHRVYALGCPSPW